jgi:hypothetical protein
MIIADFKANKDLVESTRDAFSDELHKTILQTMDESSPVYQEVAETKDQSSDAKYWFTRGYYNYHKTLQELGKSPSPIRSLRTNYGKPKEE